MAREDGGDGDGGEQTNTWLPYLATVRTLVATVVTMLAAVVVVMVIIVVNRPEKIVLYIDYGYIQAEQMWWKERQVDTTRAVVVVYQLPCSRFEAGRTTPDLSSTVGKRPYGVSNRGYGSVVDDCEDGGSTTVFEPVDKVELSVAVTAYNPSGRGKPILCNITTIRVLDVNNSYSGVAIGSVVYRPEEPIVFHVLPQTTYTKRWTVTINDNATLHYLNQRHQQITHFPTMVQVDVAYSEKMGNISFYCSPVTLGYGVPSTKNEEDTPCLTSNQMTGYSVTWYPPPPLVN